LQPPVNARLNRQFGNPRKLGRLRSDENLRNQLLNGHHHLRGVVPSGAFLERQLRAEVYQKLDKSLLPNLRNVDPEVARAVAHYDPGNQYAVDYMWITSGVGYNAGDIRARLPEAPTDSWRMLFDP